MYKRIAALCVVCLASVAWADIQPADGFKVYPYFTPQLPADKAGQWMVGFDRGPDKDLYFTTGDFSPAMTLWRYGQSGLAEIWSGPDYAGAGVLVTHSTVYFTEDMNFTLYRYGTRDAAAPVAEYSQPFLYGLAVQGRTLYATGLDGNWQSSVYASQLQPDGSLADKPMLNLGIVGDPSGPLSFDGAGNLYYASGYASARILKYSAAEVQAALAGQTPLGQPEQHVWASFAATGLDGATGLAFDGQGNLVASLTSFGYPSKLERFNVDAEGNFGGLTELANSTGRISAVQFINGVIAAADESGIYTLDRPRIPGDSNRDGKVTFADYQALESNFGTRALGWESGDFDGNGLVNFGDYQQLEANFGQSIPEPASLCLLLAGMVALRRKTARGKRG